MNNISPNDPERLREALVGLLLGTAVGDALGLPAEGMSRQRIHRRWRGCWRHRFLFGRGMCSDDTEHTFFVAQALLAHPKDPVAFQRCLAWKLRLWLLGVPAGVGFATLKATLRLWMGFPPHRSGVRSAGNGAAMRSAVLGVYFAEDPAARREFVAAATQLTHTDERARTAALAMAEAAAIASRRGTEEECLARLRAITCDAEWVSLCHKMAESLADSKSAQAFADSLGLQNGVTGYAYHSVPVAIYAWLRHRDDFRTALEAALNCGGDTDTVGSMVGALAGAANGKRAIPQDWLQGLWEWPRSPVVLRAVGERLAEQKLGKKLLRPVQYAWPALIPRNTLFAIVVLLHGLRRLLPPY